MGVETTFTSSDIKIPSRNWCEMWRVALPSPFDKNQGAHTHTNSECTFTPSASCCVCVCVPMREVKERWREKRTRSYAETIKHQKELSVKEDYVRYNTDGMENWAKFSSFFIIKRLSFLNKTPLAPPHPPLDSHTTYSAESTSLHMASLHLPPTQNPRTDEFKESDDPM